MGAVLPGQFKRTRRGPEPGDILLIDKLVKYLITIEQRALAAEQTLAKRYLGY